MSKQAVVLLSGGIDSTTCLAMAVDLYGVEGVLALSVFYGQKHRKELKAASAVSRHYGIQYIATDLSTIFQYSDCPLLEGREAIEHKSYVEQIKNLGGQGTVSTYVPFRNGLMLSYAAVIAMSVGAEVVYYGAHADDAAGRAYPDCTLEFYAGMSKAISEGTGNVLKMLAPLINLNKAQVIQKGLALDAPYHLTWSCYEGQEKPCGTCGTCIDRAHAFYDNGIEDPANRGKH